MKGKRPFRRKRMVDPRTRAMGQTPLKHLQRAHQLLERGDHANAALIFEQLAAEAMDWQLEKPAPFLYLQAARARFLSGSLKAGSERLRKGISLLAEADRWSDLERMINRIREELPAFGQQALLDEINAWVTELKAGRAEMPNPSPKPDALPRLLICKRCEAALHPDLLDWTDPGSVECVYCASPLELKG